MEEVEFTASRRSEAATGRRWLWVGVGLAVVIALLRSGPSVALLVVMAPVVAFFALVDWFYLRKQGTAGRRVALLDADGIESPAFSTREKRFAWAEVASVQVTAPSGVRSLELLLHPTPGRPDRRAFWSGVNRARPSLPLNALQPAEQERLVDLVVQRIGAPPGAADELRAERVFRDRMEALAPRTWLTWVLVALNVGVWAAMALAGANGWTADTQVLLDWGANSAFEVVERDAWWRLLTATFLHGGALHLAMNMAGLASAGPIVERLYGRLQFALIYFGAALAGSALSLHYASQHAVSAGASGAVFGVFAAMLAGLHRQRKDMPQAMRKKTLGGLTLFVGYSLAMGLASPRIDNAAHVGGLLAGAVLALLLPRQLDAERFRTLWRSRSAVGAALVAVAVAVLVAQAPPGIDQREVFASATALEQGLRRLEEAQRAIVRDQEAIRTGAMTELEADERSRTVHAPKFRQARDLLAVVRLPPQDPRAAFAADALRFTQVVEEMLAMDSEIVDGKLVPARPERFKVLEAEAARLLQRLQERLQRLKQARR